jgi:hypothetical protein
MFCFGGHLRLELSCIQVNMVIGKTVRMWSFLCVFISLNFSCKLHAYP